MVFDGKTMKGGVEKNSTGPGAGESRTRYLKRLKLKCSVLPMAALGGEKGTEEDVGMDQVYVELDTTTRVPLSTEEKSTKRKASASFSGNMEDRPLSASEAALRNAPLALLGDPGSGKSAFVRQLAASLASALLGGKDPPPGWENPPLPIFVGSGDLSPGLEKLDMEGKSREKRDALLLDVLWDRLRSQLKESHALEFEAGLVDSLADGQALLILDGLDETPEALRPRVKELLAAVGRSFSEQKRIIVTCRVRSYPENSALPSFKSHTLARFDDEKIRTFTGAWYKAQADLGRMGKDESMEKAGDLASAALSTKLRELSSNPMLLTVMAIIHQKDVGLPRERVRLYKRAVETLLVRWQRDKGNLPGALKSLLDDDLKLWETMEILAYEAHVKEAAGKKGSGMDRLFLLGLLEKKKYLGDVALADRFLEYVDQRAGLLRGEGGDEESGHPQVYAFPHRTFQEYLAGRHLAGKRGASREYLECAKEKDFWQDAAKLGAEELLYNGGTSGKKNLMDLAYDLCPPNELHIGEQRNRATLWSGHMAELLGVDTIEEDSEIDGGISYLERLLDRLPKVMMDSPLTALERAEAGRVLSKLGDPREEVLLPEKMEFKTIGNGPFLMGNGKEEYKIPYDYKISRFPVTNAQYDAFVKAGGYNVKEYWTAAEKAGMWKIEENKGTVKGPWDDSWRDRPADFGEPFNLANHPVVGVSWYEALAFCLWLTDWLRRKGKLRKDEEIRLPSEPEWEKAARGADGLIYPWGKEPDPDKANYNDTKIGTTSAVGCFPKGKSVYGVEEMSGNVWEWTRSLWGEDWQKPNFVYPYNSADGRENLDATVSVLRVLRGGAFNDDYWDARCAVRYWVIPVDGYCDIGFRVIASPKNTSEL